MLLCLGHDTTQLESDAARVIIVDQWGEKQENQIELQTERTFKSFLWADYLQRTETFKKVEKKKAYDKKSEQ